ncbi:MAG: heliorhodopsin HeR [Saccharofermentanales bacterium]
MMSTEINFKSLRRFNLIMGILHLIQGSAMLFLAISIDKFSGFKLPVFSNFLKFDTTSMRLVTDNNKMFDVPFAICVSSFLFISALFHFIIVLPKCNDAYNRYLGKGMNPFRWYEYSLSSSVMIVLIALLFGVYDIGLLIAIFILNASMNLFGLLMEQINQYTQKTSWSAFIFGSLAGIGPWIVIVMYAFGNSDLSKVPWFVYAIFGSYFVFFNLFPINMVLQYKKIGKWRNYIYGERAYVILSLVAKSVLAWLVFAGVMQP